MTSIAPGSTRIESSPAESKDSSSSSSSQNNYNEKVFSAKEFAIELTLSVILSFGVFYTARVIQRYFGGGYENPNLMDVDKKNETAVDRLTSILRKRHIQRMLDAEQLQAEETDDESTVDGEGNQTRQQQDKAKKSHDIIIADHYNHTHNHNLTLTSHESHIAEDIIDPDDIDISFDDIGGIDGIKQEMWELAILPLIRPDLFHQSKLISSQATSGILLYGRPGTGKTMLAKAIAREAKAIFIPIQLSKILNKWVGESNKLVSATFSLARKLAPAIIFIDEIDTFLYKGNSLGGSGGNIDQLKSEFLTLWDGISVNNGGGEQKILVLGATNKPENIEPAIRRRMPRAFEVPLPNEQGRYQIINILCKDQLMEEDARNNFLPTLAQDEYTKHYSGSDLKELCRTAFMEPIREITSELAKRAVGNSTSDDNKRKRSSKRNAKVRPVNQTDFLKALEKVHASYTEEQEVNFVRLDPKIVDKLRKGMVS